MRIAIGAMLAVSAGLIVAAQGAGAAEPVAITVLSDPIYSGTPIFDSAAKIFEATDVVLKTAPVPASRILGMIKANTEPDCSAGWYKTADRASYALFTRPFRMDLPYVGLVRASYHIDDETTARQTLERPTLRLGVKQGFSYTPFFDELIARMPPSHVVAVTGDIPSIVKMIHSDHLDMLIAHEAEVENFVAETRLAMSDFKLVKFADAPKEVGVAIMCSAQVPPEVIDKLNAAIAATMTP